MSAPKAKIVSFEIRQDGESASVLFRFGTEEISKQLPSGHGIVRGSAILDGDGKLVDCELVTQKV